MRAAVLPHATIAASWSARVTPEAITQRVLHLAVPISGTTAQIQALRRLTEYARSMAVELRITVYP